MAGQASRRAIFLRAVDYNTSGQAVCELRIDKYTHQFKSPQSPLHWYPLIPRCLFSHTWARTLWEKDRLQIVHWKALAMVAVFWSLFSSSSDLWDDNDGNWEVDIDFIWLQAVMDGILSDGRRLCLPKAGDPKSSATRSDVLKDNNHAISSG